MRGCLDHAQKLLNFAFDKCWRFAFGPRKSLSLDFPGRIHGQHSFFGEPGKQHPDGGQVLFDGRGRASMVFDVDRDMDRFDIFKIGETGSFTPVKELADRLMIR